MKKIIWILLIQLIVGKNLYSQQPKLVIGIVVDQMRYDYIYRFWDELGNQV